MYSTEMTRLDSNTLSFPFAYKVETSDSIRDHIAASQSLRNSIFEMDTASIPSFVEHYRLELNLNKFHLHDHAQITYCEKGSMVYIFEKGAVILKEGDILFLNPFIPHSWISLTADSARYQIGFNHNMLSADDYSQSFIPYFQILFSGNHQFVRSVPGNQYYDQLKKCILSVSELATSCSFSYESMVHSYLFMFSQYLVLSLPDFSMMENSQNNKIILRILDYIDDHIGEDLSGITVAEHIGLNSSYFSTYFKKHLGTSFKQYVITKRVAKAAALLQHTDKSITHILYECGFSSISAFYDAFHKVYFMSPNSFRKLSTHKLNDKYADS